MRKEDAQHLMDVLQENYAISKDWEGERYNGITLDWGYVRWKVHLSMPEYVKDTLVRFAHELCKLTHQPHKHTLPVYGRTIQHAKEENKSPLLDKEGKEFVQQVTGTFLYYARAVDPTMSVALSAISACQSAPTEHTMEKTLFFLDYAASHPDAILMYAASAMILNIRSDASYLTEPKARSRAGSHWFMSAKERNTKKQWYSFKHCKEHLQRSNVCSQRGD